MNETEQLDDIIHRMRVTKLESRLELLEIERTALKHELDSRITLPQRKVEVFDRCDEIESQRSNVIAELELERHTVH